MLYLLPPPTVLSRPLAHHTLLSRGLRLASQPRAYISTMPKRSRAVAAVAATEDMAPPPKRTPIPLPSADGSKRRSSARKASNPSTNPDVNDEVIDGPNALRASPDSTVDAKIAPFPQAEPELPSPNTPDSKAEPKGRGKGKKSAKGAGSAAQAVETPKKSPVKAEDVGEDPLMVDPESEDEDFLDEDEIKKAVSRPPPVHSDYLPLPWKGRLGYACLNTYLRNATPPVFSSRTCRISSILDHRHPLKDPSQPEHATKNRPDKDQPADVQRGKEFVESLGLANARDIIKMVRWNDKYGIKFLRLSSEMFPFASHEEYGYKLAPFASETLAEAGKVVAELGHRVTTHPGQFTQLGSPRKSVIDNAIRDLEYHDEMLSLLKLPPQQDRDAVMILHLGGTFGDKAATLDRFRENYARLAPSIKNRLVLENDDVSWTVHDLLPLCEELNIPLVLDFHHHNILFDAAQVREGTRDAVGLFPAIAATWRRKNITQKMHYSEPTPAAVTPTQRRKHNPRPASLPPCPPDMDLMIEAKDKEQAVFELMRNFKLPGWDSFNDVVPHVRRDENKPPRPVSAAKKKKVAAEAKKRAAAAKKKEEEEAGAGGADDVVEAAAEVLEEEDAPPPVVPEEEIGMGGPERRVYWPPGMEEWLRPVKRVVKKKEDGGDEKVTPAKKRKGAVAGADTGDAGEQAQDEGVGGAAAKKQKPAPKKKKTPTKAGAGKRAKAAKSVPTPSTSDGEEDELAEMPELDDGEEGGGGEAEPVVAKGKNARKGARSSGRAGRAKVNYNEEMSE